MGSATSPATSARHGCMGKPCRAMSLAMCGTGFGDIALAQNHIARCRWRCAGLALATSPWLRITSRDVAGDVWRSSLRSPYRDSPFVITLLLGAWVQCWALLLSLGATLVIGRKSCNWVFLWPSRGGARSARRKEGWPACGRPRHVARHDLGALAMSRDVAKGGWRCRATWPRRLWRHRATWKMGVGDVARRRPRGLATSPATSRNHAFTSRDIATWPSQLLFSY